jgi:hypothetical protein
VFRFVSFVRFGGGDFEPSRVDLLVVGCLLIGKSIKKKKVRGKDSLFSVDIKRFVCVCGNNVLISVCLFLQTVLFSFGVLLCCCVVVV